MKEDGPLVTSFSWMLARKFRNAPGNGLVFWGCEISLYFLQVELASESNGALRFLGVKRSS